MKHARIPVALLTACLLLAASAPALAQARYTLSDASQITVDGTSNKSDWTVYATEFSGSAAMAPSDDAMDVKTVSLSIASEKVLSNKSSIMDRLMHRALNVREHPAIVYSLSGVEMMPDGANGFKLKTTGNLTLAGTTKPIQMTVQGKKLGNGSVQFTGSHKLLMTDYGMEPPSAMFGSLRTGDEVTVKFDVTFEPAAAGQ